MIIVHRKLEGLSEGTLARFTARARRAAGIRGQVNVLLTDSREMRGLNRCFRGKDTPTDVLSFPPIEHARRNFSGDLVICAEIAAENARRLGHPPVTEVKILVLHGLLHLAGYDHETDQGQMARREDHLRRELNLPVSLIGRAEQPRRRRRS